MSERDIRYLLQDLEGVQKSPEVFETEMKAWNDAVSTSDYICMFRAGSILKTNIFGLPYGNSLDALRDCVYSDMLAQLHRELTSEGLQAIDIAKPKLEELFPGPVGLSQEEHQAVMFTGANSDHLREVYQSHFLKLMYNRGFRDILLTGVQGYLDKVPDHLSLFTFCAPNATKSFITQDGYFAMGYNIAPDMDRPLSQRGGERGFLRTEFAIHAEYFDNLTSQISFLVDNLDNFAFDASDLLGYRPKDMSDAGIVTAWDGWQSHGLWTP